MKDDLASGRAKSITVGYSDLKVTADQWNEIFNPKPAKQVTQEQLDHVNGFCLVHGGPHQYFRLAGPVSPACVGWVSRKVFEAL